MTLLEKLAEIEKLVEYPHIGCCECCTDDEEAANLKGVVAALKIAVEALVGTMDCQSHEFCGHAEESYAALCEIEKAMGVGE